MVTVLTADQFLKRIVRENPHGHGQVLAILNEWLAKGHGVAVYVHEKHRELSLMASYGDQDAILGPDPARRLFDSLYVLAGVYRGEPLKEEP